MPVGPGLEVVEQGLAGGLPGGEAYLGGFARDFGFDLVETGDAAHRLLGDRRLRCGKHLEEFPARMSKAGDVRHPRRLVAAGAIERAVAGKSIGVQEPAEAGEMLARPFPIAIGAVAIERRRRTDTRPDPRVDSIDPEAGGAGLTVAGGQHLDRGVVGMDHRRSHHVLADPHCQG